jgi:hypothetical protein
MRCAKLKEIIVSNILKQEHPTLTFTVLYNARATFSMKTDKCLHDIWLGIGAATSVNMRSSIFWNIIPCSPLKFDGSFGGTSCLDLQV